MVICVHWFKVRVFGAAGQCVGDWVKMNVKKHVTEYYGVDHWCVLNTTDSGFDLHTNKTTNKTLNVSRFKSVSKFLLVLIRLVGNNTSTKPYWSTITLLDIDKPQLDHWGWCNSMPTGWMQRKHFYNQCLQKRESTNQKDWTARNMMFCCFLCIEKWWMDTTSIAPF